MWLLGFPRVPWAPEGFRSATVAQGAPRVDKFRAKLEDALHGVQSFHNSWKALGVLRCLRDLGSRMFFDRAQSVQVLKTRS